MIAAGPGDRYDLDRFVVAQRPVPDLAALNIPTSFQMIVSTPYVVTLTGEVWRLADVAVP